MRTTLLATALLSAFALSGCMKQPVDEMDIIAPNETAFLVSLEGDTKKDQNKLKSIDYLNANKVSAKRVYIPHKIIDTCPSCTMTPQDQKKDVATAILFKINRTPITREWTGAVTTGTKPSNEAFPVESVESIDFDIGATITAHVSEEDAAKFLYYYSGQQLADIIDTNIRSYIGTIVAREFGKLTYDDCRVKKSDVFAVAEKAAMEFFGARGITIDNLGYTEGMTPHDKRIQTAINERFVADQAVGTANQQMLAAKKIAEASDAVRIKQDLDIRMKQVEIATIMANRWDGHGIMPTYVVGADGRVVVNAPVDIAPKK